MAIGALVVGFAAPAQATPAGPSKIIGGTVTPISAVPWQVALVDPTVVGTEGDGQFCGGSVINAKWVITAAHCLSSYRRTTLGIFAGNNNLGVTSGTDEYTADKWILHPDYTGDFHDIALVKLKDTDPFNLASPNIDPIALPVNVNPTTFPAVGQAVTVSGWGDTNPTTVNTYPDLLQSTVLNVISGSSSVPCGSYGSGDWNPRYELCVGTSTGGYDTCQGDSGGPYAVLNIDGNNDLAVEPTLIGVTSWGNGCALAAYPGIATRVTSYLDWIIPMQPTVTITFNKKTKTHTLKWVAPLNQSVSSPVTGFRIEYSTNYGMTWKLATTAAVTAKSYSKKIAKDTLWRIAAVNEVNNDLGPYLWADQNGLDGARTVAAPSAPTGLRQMATSGQLRFSWGEPANINGTAITGYRLYRMGLTGLPTLLLTTKSRSNVETPRANLPSEFWVTAINNAGESVESTHVKIAR